MKEQLWLQHSAWRPRMVLKLSVTGAFSAMVIAGAVVRSPANMPRCPESIHFFVVQHAAEEEEEIGDRGHIQPALYT